MDREAFAATKLLAVAASLALFACATSAVGAAGAASRTFGEELQLPTSTAEGAVPPGLAVTVTKSAILVDGTVVAPIAGNRVDPKLKPEGEDGYRITPLIEALEKRTTRNPEAARRTGRQVDTPLTLIADRALAYRLLTEIIYSCGQAGYDKYDLVVEKASDGSRVAIRYTVPEISAGHDAPPRTMVRVHQDRFEIVARGGASADIPTLGNGRYDYERMTARLNELTADDGERGPVTLMADAGVPYEVVVATMDAMRRTRDGTPLFPVVEFGAGVR